jgi:hypothetical protein
VYGGSRDASQTYYRVTVITTDFDKANPKP